MCPSMHFLFASVFYSHAQVRFFYYLPLFVLFRLPKYGLFFASVFYSPTQVRSFHLPAKICYSHAQVPVASHSTRNMTMII